MKRPLQFSRHSLVACLVALATLMARPAGAGDATDAWLRSVDQMMAGLGPQSARDAATIRELYAPHLKLLLLNKYADVETALATGGLVPLPSNLESFNMAPRLVGL